MAVEDFMHWNNGRWGIEHRDLFWHVWPSVQCVDGGTKGSRHPTFAEAHAAYLDAVTCDSRTPFPNYTEPRCTRSREHRGGHKFTGKNGMTNLEQMPK